MKKSATRSTNFADALATEMAFAVLIKTGRIQVLIKPTPKQLRKRGKRGWELFGVVDEQSDARKVLEATLKRAILEIEGADRAPHNKKRKGKQGNAGK